LKKRKRKISLLKRVTYSIFSLVLFVIAFAVYSNYIIESNSEKHTFSNVDEVPYNKVGVLLGTSKYYEQGGINLYFKYRIEAAVELFNSGKIDFILVSGDNGTEFYNEPKTIMEALIEHGIPKSKIYLDYAGFRTLDSIIRANKIFGLNKFTVISQQFHNERAIYLATKKGIEVVGFNAKDVEGKNSVKIKTREYFARVKAVLDVIFHVQPKFLGEEIVIE